MLGDRPVWPQSLRASALPQNPHTRTRSVIDSCGVCLVPWLRETPSEAPPHLATPMAQTRRARRQLSEASASHLAIATTAGTPIRSLVDRLDAVGLFLAARKSTELAVWKAKHPNAICRRTSFLPQAPSGSLQRDPVLGIRHNDSSRLRAA